MRASSRTPVTRRSRRSTSRVNMSRKRPRSSSLSARAAVSAALLIAASGLRNSCETSLANCSTARMCASSRPRQLRQRPRQVAQFILAARVLEPPRQPAAALGEIRSLARQPRQRLDDGRSRHCAQDGGRQDRCDHHLEDAKPDVVNSLQNTERRLRHEHGADDHVVSPDGHGAIERERALTGRWTRRRAVPAGERSRQFRRNGTVVRSGVTRSGTTYAQACAEAEERAACGDDAGTHAIQRARPDTLGRRRIGLRRGTQEPTAMLRRDPGRWSPPAMSRRNRRRGAVRRRAARCGSAARRPARAQSCPRRPMRRPADGPAAPCRVPRPRGDGSRAFNLLLVFLPAAGIL